MRTRIAVALLLLVLGTPRWAASLDLPVRRAGESTPAPCWMGDVLEIRLTAAAASAARRRDAAPTRAGRLAELGVPALDALARVLGGATFEPEFVGETPPVRPGETDFTAFRIVHLPAGVTLEDALARFRALAEVASADPIAVLPVQALPNDSLFARQLGLYQPASRLDAHAPEAWDTQRGDTSIVLGVIDTGVLPYHPDLGGRGGVERGNLFVNSLEASGTPGVDDDGNGFVDDVSGWDFIHIVPNPPGRYPGEDTAVQDPDPNDFAGHGTAVASLAGAIGDNGIGLAGAAWRVRILPLRIGWGTFQSPFGEVRMDFAAAAIRYATRMGANVVNCSFASLATNGVDAAVADAARAGVLVVIAAGNNGAPSDLGLREDVITVAATDSNDVVAAFSNRYPAVDVAANGVQAVAAFVAHVGSDSLGNRQPDYRLGLDGTSFSAPLVAGGLALLQSHRRAQGLDPLSPLGAILRVRETADDIRAQNPALTGYGTGRLNLQRLLTDPPRSLAVRAGALAIGAPVVLRQSAGGVRVFTLTNDARLVAFDGSTGDTVSSVALGAAAASPLAAGRAGGLPFALFAGTSAGSVIAFTPAGDALPAWPATGSSVSDVAIADVTGDGEAEVVAASADGRVWAWRGDRSSLAGWPRDLAVAGSPRIALADLDGAPGDEVITADAGGTLRVFSAAAPSAPLWSANLGAAPGAPIVTRLGGPAAAPSVVVGAGTTLFAFAPDGAPRWSRALAGPLTGEPVAGDFDGDGTTELLLSIASPAQLELRDSTGADAGLAGWPRSLAAAAQGGPVAGPLAGATGAACLVNGQVLAFAGDGTLLSAFPKPGLATGPLTLAELDADGATEIVAGGASDSTWLVYDAGAGSWNAAGASWPTPRATFARTGSTLRGTGTPELDDVAPGAVAALEAVLSGTRTVTVRWVTSGDDGAIGRAASVRTVADTPGRPALVHVQPAAAPGAPDSTSFTSLAEGVAYTFSVEVTDDGGNVGPAATSAPVAIPTLVPAAVQDLSASLLADTAAVLHWTATGGDGVLGRPLLYYIAIDDEPIASFDPGEGIVRTQLHRARVDAGGAEADTVRALARGRAWFFAVVAEDSTGLRSPLSNVPQVVTPVGGALRGRTGIAIAARGNPARIPVVIDWQGAPGALGSAQTLRIVDVTGRLVRTFALGGQAGGTLTWDGRDSDGGRVPAGLYFARFESGSFRTSARIALAP